jgi:hypothetical protein
VAISVGESGTPEGRHLARHAHEKGVTQCHEPAWRSVVSDGRPTNVGIVLLDSTGSDEP